MWLNCLTSGARVPLTFQAGSPLSYDVLEGRARERGDAHHAVVQTFIEVLTYAPIMRSRFDFMHCLQVGGYKTGLKDY